MSEKHRPHEGYHIRSAELQILDTLLRIEELLIAQAKPVITGEPEPTPPAPPKRGRK